MLNKVIMEYTFQKTRSVKEFIAREHFKEIYLNFIVLKKAILICSAPVMRKSPLFFKEPRLGDRDGAAVPLATFACREAPESAGHAATAEETCSLRGNSRRWETHLRIPGSFLNNL